MLLTAKAKVVTDLYAGERLLKTMEQFNAACNFVSEIAWREKTFGKYDLHKQAYYDIRKNFGLSSQMAIRVIGKVSETYKAEREVKHTFKKHGAIVYDQRILTFKSLDTISILTIDERVKCPIIVGGYRPLHHKYVRGQADLIYDNGTFYLLVVVDVPEKEMNDNPSDVIGVDLGITNIAATSDGKVMLGEQAKRTRKRYQSLKARLQQAGTWNAKKLSKKERRFKRDLNHSISKAIVSEAEGTGRGIALEDLEGIRERSRDRKTVARTHRDNVDKWAFFELRNFIDYKARLNGVPVYVVDPRYTSQECSICGHTERANRSGERFACRMCGHTMHADVNAAINIRRRADVSQPIALRPTEPQGQEESGSASPRALAVGS